MVTYYKFVETLFDGVQEHLIPSVAIVNDASITIDKLPEALIQVVASDNDYDMVDTLDAETSEMLRVTVDRIESVDAPKAKVFKELFPNNVYLVGKVFSINEGDQVPLSNYHKGKIEEITYLGEDQEYPVHIRMYSVGTLKSMCFNRKGEPEDPSTPAIKIDRDLYEGGK